MGHGVSVMLLGITAFFVKGKIISQQAESRVLTAVLSKASSVMEIAVGLSLVVIGIMGMKEAREWVAEDDDDEDEQPPPKSLSAAAVNVPTTFKHQQQQQNTGGSTTVIVKGQTRAVLLNGLLHGFSWDGAPSLAPACH
jgi:hypothetical protein